MHAFGCCILLCVNKGGLSPLVSFLSWLHNVVFDFAPLLSVKFFCKQFEKFFFENFLCVSFDMSNYASILNIPLPPPPPPPLPESRSAYQPYYNVATALPTNNYVLKNKNGYKNWIYRIEWELRAHGLLDIVRGKPPLNISSSEIQMMDARAVTLISGRIDDKILSNFAHAKTANELMESVKESFERRSATAALDCFRKLINLKFNENTSMQAHISKFESLLRELDAFGEPFPHGLRCLLLLSSLPSTTVFSSVVTTLGSLPKESISLDYVKQNLLDTEGMQKMRVTSENSSALLADSNKPRRHKRKSRPSGEKSEKAKRFVRICYSCRAEGHLANNCPANKEKPQKGRESRPVQEKTQKGRESARSAPPRALMANDNDFDIQGTVSNFLY